MVYTKRCIQSLRQAFCEKPITRQCISASLIFAADNRGLQLLTARAEIHRPTQVTGLLDDCPAVRTALSHGIPAEHHRIPARPAEQVLLRIPASCGRHFLQSIGNRLVDLLPTALGDSAHLLSGVKPCPEQDILEIGRAHV